MSNERKILWEKGSFKLVITDDRNYSLGTEYLDNDNRPQLRDISYFNTIEQAVKRIATLEANDAAYDLKSWLDEYKKTLKYFAEIFDGTNT
jgi:hypothetical protein